MADLDEKRVRMLFMPRRSNLSGKLRPDGRYEIRITLTRLDGAKVRKSVYGKTLTEAQAEAHALIFESGRGYAEGVTLAELADLWRRSWRVKPATQRSYEYALSLIEPRLGKRVCHELKVPELMGLVLRADTDRKSRLVRTVLGTMLSYGVMVGALEQNPMIGLRTPRTYTPRRRRVTVEILEAMLEGIPDDLKAFFEFLADTGLRPWREAIELKRSDIGYKNDEWFVKVRSSKTAAGIRLVPISDAKLAHGLMDRTGELFPFSASTYKRAWAKVSNDVPIYALRALAIARWCESGVDLDVVKMRAGHTDIRLTLDIYNEVRQDRILTGQRGQKGVKISEILARNDGI